MVDVSGVTNGHADDEDDAARPFKKFKAQNGSAVAPDIGDGTEEAIEMDGEDGDDDVDETLEDDEVDGEDAGEDGGGEDDEGEEEGEEEDKDSRDDLAAAAGLRDEALDEHGSDSD